MASYSKTIAARVKRDPRLDEYYADSDGHWIDLVRGYNWGGGSIVHELTVKETLEALRDIETGLTTWELEGFPLGPDLAAEPYSNDIRCIPAIEREKLDATPDKITK